MVNIDWYYARTGKGQVAEIVSYSAPVQNKLRAVAYERAALAQAILNSEPKVRTGDSQVKVSQGDLDYYVELTDPLGKGAGVGIEARFGVLRRVF